MDHAWSVAALDQEDERLGTYTFELEGFILGRNSPVVAINVVDNGRLLQKIQTGVNRPDVAARRPNIPHAPSSGFHTRISSLCFQPEFRVNLRAVFENGFEATIGSLEGRRPPLRTNFEPELQPLMVTMLGRSGSTLLLHMLASHPQIVAYKPFTAEARVASYWKDVLLALASPGSYVNQISPFGPLIDHWWVGDGAPGIPATRDEPTEGWLDACGIEAITAMCQSRVDAFYKQISSDTKPDALYFAEKSPPGAGNPLPSLQDEIYEKPREVVLVRDFRDMICSMRAYSAKMRTALGDSFDAGFAPEDDSCMKNSSGYGDTTSTTCAYIGSGGRTGHFFCAMRTSFSILSK